MPDRGHLLRILGHVFLLLVVTLALDTTNLSMCGIIPHTNLDPRDVVGLKPPHRTAVNAATEHRLCRPHLLLKQTLLARFWPCFQCGATLTWATAFPAAGATLTTPYGQLIDDPVLWNTFLYISLALLLDLLAASNDVEVNSLTFMCAARSILRIPSLVPFCFLTLVKWITGAIPSLSRKDTH